MSIWPTRPEIREPGLTMTFESAFNNSESLREQTPKGFASKLRKASRVNRLTIAFPTAPFAPLPRVMSKVCTITGSRATRGSIIHRRGMAKKKGGVGRHVTKNVPRVFSPNLHEHRIWVPELKKFVRIKVSARGLKTINKNGAYATLKKAGLIAA